jgi:hypothetical protein
MFSNDLSVKISSLSFLNQHGCTRTRTCTLESLKNFHLRFQVGISSCCSNGWLRIKRVQIGKKYITIKTVHHCIL